MAAHVTTNDTPVDKTLMKGAAGRAARVEAADARTAMAAHINISLFYVLHLANYASGPCGSQKRARLHWPQL